MAKVTITFTDTQKQDLKGNPVVDIDLESVPKMPFEDREFSPAQKAAIQIMQRSGQPDIVEFLGVIEMEALELEKALKNLGIENVVLPFDFAMARQQAANIASIVQQKINTYK